MEKKSLIEARNLIIDTLSKSNIDDLDKLELMLNLSLLLNEEKYDKSIKVLQKNKF